MNFIKPIMPIIFVLLFNGASFSQQKISNYIDTAARIGKLPNGLTYFIRKNNDAEEKILLKLVVNAGIYHEDDDQFGFAHLLEHVAFNGTKNYPNDSLMKYFGSLGFTLGKDWNANTGKATVYFINAPSNNKEVLDNSLQVIRDWAGDLQLDPKEMDDERGIVIGEANQGASKLSVVSDEVNAKVLNHPKYSVNQIAKHDLSIKTASIENLKRFYEDWYRPDLEAVIIVGRFDVGEMEKKIISLFSDLKMPENPRKIQEVPKHYDVKLDDKNKFFTIRSRELQEISLKIYKKRKAGLKVNKTKDDIRQFLIDDIYNKMIEVRLDQIGESDQSKPYNSISNSIARNIIHPSAQLDALLTHVEIKRSKSIQSALTVVVAELSRIANLGFTKDEFTVIVDNIEKDLKRSNGNTISNQVLADRYENFFVDGTDASSPEEEVILKLEILKGIMLSDVNSYANLWINESKNTDVIILVPEDLNIVLPNREAVFAWIDEAKKIHLPTFELKKPIKVNINLLENIELPKVDSSSVVTSIVTYDKMNTSEIKFNNGLRLVLKTIKSDEVRDSKIRIDATKLGGLKNYHGSDLNNALNVGLINLNSVTNKYDKQHVDAFKNEHGISLRTVLREGTSEIHALCSDTSIETLLQLLYLQLKYPSKSKESFDQAKARMKNDIKNRILRRDANGFRESVQRLLFSTNPSLKQLTEEEIDKIDIDRTYEIFKENFSAPEGYTIVVTGDFDEKSILSLFVKYLGSFKKSNLKVDTSRVHPSLKNFESRSYYMGSYTRAHVQLYFSAHYEFSEKNDLKKEIITNAIQIKMNARLREKEGGTYNVTTMCQNLSPLNSDFFYCVDFECDLNAVEKMIAAAKDEISILQSKGFDKELLEQSKERTKEENRRVLSSRFWSEYLTFRYLNNLSPDYILKKEKLIDEISLTMLNEAANEYLQHNKIFQFVLLPENNK